jgi:hypothetical protein
VQQVIVLKERAEALAAEVKTREEAVLKAAERSRPAIDSRLKGSVSTPHLLCECPNCQELEKAVRNLRGEK